MGVPVPDEDRRLIVRAYIQTERKPDAEFIEELQEIVKAGPGKFECLREIEFLVDLPKTVGGKTDRKALKIMADV